MAEYKCPFCGVMMEANSMLTKYSTRHNFRDDFSKPNAFDAPYVDIDFFECPSCEQVSILLDLHDGEQTSTIPIRPNSTARRFPNYIPEAIRQDYEEACAIVHLSPKASATLARRCLQGMIRDFWEIVKPRLVDEINELQGKIPDSQWKVIDAIRRIGNIGAHMEKDINTIVDIEPNEAYKLIKLIELLMEKWYIARHDEQQLYDDILDIDQDKKNAKAN